MTYFYRTCLRFNALVADRFLWGKFDFSGQPMSASEILQRFFYLTDKTHTFNVSGLRSLYPSRKWKNTTITRNLLDRLVAKCPQLVRMSVEEANIDVNEVCVWALFWNTIYVYSSGGLTFSVFHSKLSAATDQPGAASLRSDFHCRSVPEQGGHTSAGFGRTASGALLVVRNASADRVVQIAESTAVELARLSIADELCAIRKRCDALRLPETARE